MIQQSKIDRIKELVELLNKAGKSYYSEGRELMSNYEYDALYDELGMLEKETGYVLSNSPTVNVGYEVLSELPKERQVLIRRKVRKRWQSGLAVRKVCFHGSWTV